MEVLNDLNGEISNFYQQLRENFDELQHCVQKSLLCRETYHDAMHVYNRPNMVTPVKRAWAFWVVTQQGWASKIGSFGYGVKDNKRETSLYNKRISFTETLEQRLQTVVIENADAVKVIKSRDRETSFFYIDPPYFNSDMGHYGGYTEKDFVKLLDCLVELKGKFLLSSYPSEVLKSYIERNNWHTKAFEMQLCASAKGGKKVEVVTANFAM